jgi:hypothetical protein
MTKTPNKNGRKTDGTFALGNALGGRTKGSRNGTTLAVEALRLCLERICPPRKDRPVLFDLPAMTNSKDAASAMAGIIMAVADGDMTPDEAGSVTCIIEQYRRTLETTELEGRLQALEQATSKGN